VSKRTVTVIRRLDNLQDKLDKLAEKASPRELGQALKFAAEPVVESAKSRVSVRTKELRNDIHSRLMQANTAGVTVVVGTKHFYGRFLETGTRRMAARPWLRPALDENQDEVVRRFRGEIRRLVLQVARG